jgi:hypothetical protein
LQNHESKQRDRKLEITCRNDKENSWGMLEQCKNAKKKNLPDLVPFIEKAKITSVQKINLLKA